MIIRSLFCSLLGLLPLLRDSLASNPCHSDCEPFQCHGPLSTQCSRCTGNREPSLSTCQCKLGYFDHNGLSCSVYSFDCAEGTVDVQGQVTCTRCSHGVNGPTAGACVLLDYPYTQTSVNPVQNVKSNSNSFFLTKHCNSIYSGLGQNNNCGGCISNYYLDSASPPPIACQPCALAGCNSCDATSCLSGCGAGLYLTTGNTCGYCFPSCKSCSGSNMPDACTTCQEGYYWSPNGFNSLGACLPCDSSCKTCFGAGDAKCSEAADGFFISNPGTSSAQSLPCDPSCAKCAGTATTCTACFRETDSNYDYYVFHPDTNECVLEDASMYIDGCLVARLMPDNSYVCDQCDFHTYWNPYTLDCQSSTLSSQCNFTRITSDQNSYECTGCGFTPSLALNKDSGVCEQFSGVGTECLKPVSLSGKYFCKQCSAGHSTNLDTGLCVTTCPAGTVAAVFNGASYCTVLPMGCLDGYFNAAGEFFCSQCDTPNFVKNNPTDLGCMNLICNNQYLGANKQCSPVLTPATCDNYLCFKTDTPDECIAGTCKRKMWTIAFDGLDFVLKVNSRYDFHLSFNMREWATYEATPAGDKKVFCRLISDDLNDDLSTCVYSNGALKIRTVDPKYRQLLTQGSISIKSAPFKIFRKYLSIDNVDINTSATNFAFDPVAPLDMNSVRDSNWVVVYQTQMPFTKGIRASVEALTKKINLGSYIWQCVTVAEDATLTAELTNLLTGSANNDLLIPLANSAFKNKQISMRVVITDEFGKTKSLDFSFTVVDAILALEQPKDALVSFVEGESFYVPLTTAASTIDTNSITVTAQGLTPSGTFSYSFEKRNSYLILSLRITSSTSFALYLSTPTTPATTLWLARKRANSPSTIIHEKLADKTTPFVFQFISRQPTFNVFCVDETNKQICLQRNNPRTYQPGEQVALQDSMNYEREGAKILFFRTVAGQDETITSSVVQGMKLPQQYKTPEISTKATTAYPESPRVQPLEEFFLDMKAAHVENVAGQPKAFTDSSFATQTQTADYVADSNKIQMTQQTIPSAFRIHTEVSFAVSNTESHQIVESRFVSSADSSTLTGKLASSGISPVLELSTAFSSAGGTCNEPSGQFIHSTNIDGQIVLSELGSYYKKSLIPGLYSSPLKVKTTVHTHCGDVSSQEASISDTSTLSPTGTLVSYMDTQLLNLGQSAREQLNSLNILALQLKRAFKLCSQNTCVFPLADVKAQVARLLTKLSPTIDETKFTITTRYSVLGAFLWEIGLLDDISLTSVVENVEGVSQLVATRILSVLESNNRLSRGLHMGLTNLDLLVPSKIDFPITLGSNLLNSVLFTFNNDTLRSDRLNRTIAQIVKLTQTKLLRISSHQRVENYEDTNIKVQGQTVLDPLPSEISFALDSSTLLVFKNLQFATPKSYYEIILIQWTADLLTRMDTIYNKTTNGFKKGFYYEFQSYFTQAVPSAGEAIILKTTCPAGSSNTGCSHPTNVPEGYSVCSCEPVVPNAGKAPSVEKVIPETPKPVPPTPPKSDPIKDLKDVIGKGDVKGLDPTKLSNFSIWCFSTIILEGTLTAVYITALFLKKKLDNHSNNFCDKLSTQIMIHKMILSTPPQSHCQESKHDEKDSDHHSENSPFGSTASSMSPEQTNLLQRLKSTGVNLDKITVKDLNPIRPVTLFFSYLKMNHMVLSLIFLQSKQYSKGTVITLTYLRIVAHLAVSMFFTLGVGTNDYSDNQRWILKIIVVPLPLLAVFTCIRRLLSGEVLLSNSVEPIRRKDSQQSNITHDSPSASMRCLDKSQHNPLKHDDEKGKCNSQNKTAEKSHGKENEPAHKNQPEPKHDNKNSHPDTTCHKENILTKPASSVTSKIGGAVASLLKYKIWFGRTALTAVLLGSVYSVLAISANSTSSKNWPWGFWYAFSLGFDQLIFQPLLALAQFTLVCKYVLGTPGETFKKATRFLIGKDIMAVFDAKSSLCHK